VNARLERYREEGMQERARESEKQDGTMNNISYKHGEVSEREREKQEGESFLAKKRKGRKRDKASLSCLFRCLLLLARN
jgi:hypothetical protein